MAKLNEAERNAALQDVPDWTYDAPGEAITRSFRFRDFNEAFGFMTRIALAAEQADHHPEWSNVWNRVNILLTTHSDGGVSAKDVSLAKRIDAFAAQLALGAGAQ